MYFQGFCIIKSLFTVLQGYGSQGFIVVSDAVGGRIGQGIVKGDQGVVYFVQEQVVHHLVKVLLGIQVGLLIFFIGGGAFKSGLCLRVRFLVRTLSRGNASCHQGDDQDQGHD